MPETVRITTSAVPNGTDRYPSLLELTGNSLERSTPEIGPAKVGQLTTRTDANTGGDSTAAREVKVTAVFN